MRYGTLTALLTLTARRALPALSLAALLALAAPTWALEENPDAPVGVVGIVVHLERSAWGDQEAELRSGSVTVTDSDDDFEQTFLRGGVSLVIPVATRATFRIGASRTASKAMDTDYFEEISSNVTIEETQKSWSFGGSLTLWLGNPSRGASTENVSSRADAPTSR